MADLMKARKCGIIALRQGAKMLPGRREKVRRALVKCFHYVLTDELTRNSRKMTSLMKEASRFSSRVQLFSEANGHLHEEKSMHSGSSITVTVEGRDEEAAVAAIADYVVTNM